MENTHSNIASDPSVRLKGLMECGVQAVVMNVFHPMRHDGSSVIQISGGFRPTL